MPRYQVIAKGFFAGHLYDPKGKRKVLHTPKPFKKGKLPSWLAEMKPESAVVIKKREAQEESAAAAAAEKHESDQKEIEDASFMGAAE